LITPRAADVLSEIFLTSSLAKENNATLIVKKFDRLSRGGLEVMARLERYKVTFIECDSPHDNTLLKEIKFSIARDEVKKISERTSAALGVIKKRVDNGETYVSKSGKVVTKLGSSENFSNEGRQKGRDQIRENARMNENNKKAWAMIQVMMKNDKFNNNKAAKQLNESGFKTANDSEFTGVQVKRLIKLFEE